jgi:molecular chaperone DnaJ
VATVAEDYYALLGVRPDASSEEIRRAYRRRARDLHPDANPHDPHAEEQFKTLSRAYEVLSDPEQRALYDRYGEAGLSGAARGGDFFGGAGSGGLGDLFDAFFGGANPFGGGSSGPVGPPRGQDLEVEADLTFEQAVFGTTLPVTVRTAVRCATCNGEGAAPGTHPVTCAECAGAGQIRRVRQSMLGQMMTTSACPRCGGLGQVVVTPCETCAGHGRLIEDREYQVDVPGGVDSGSTLRLAGRGAVGPRGGASGDLYVHLAVRPHERYVRAGHDLVTTVPVSIVQAALGTTVILPTLDGDEELRIPAGSQSGRVFTLRGRGVPTVRGRGRGDLRAELVVQVPTKLTATQEELLRRLADEMGETVDPPGGNGLFSRIKSAFS